MNAQAEERQVSGSSLFVSSDFTDVTSLAATLRADPNPSTKLISEFIWERFSADGKSVLADQNHSLNERGTFLTNELNKILESHGLYDRRRFDGLFLRNETKSLIDEELSDQRLQLLNRLLLEDVYPSYVARNPVTYLGSTLVDRNEGLYRHNVVARTSQFEAVELAWQDHASELDSFRIRTSNLIALGRVGSSSESVSLINLSRNTLLDFILCREPIVSPNGRYVAYLQFVPRHMFSADGSIPDIFLVYDLDGSKNSISGIAEDEGWVSIGANKGNVVYPEEFIDKRVFPVAPEKETNTLKARKWAADNRSVFLLIRKGSELRAVLKDMDSPGRALIRQQNIDLRKVLYEPNETNIKNIEVKEINKLDEDTIVVSFLSSPSIRQNIVTIRLNR
ncbi:MAG: hypothetical protein ACU843_17410 [Gammaproteobacteria bacterium]